MCDLHTSQAIQGAINELTDGQKMFTAFDVTLKVQQEADASDSLKTVKHGQIKNDIHREMRVFLDSGDYERRAVDLSNGRRPWVYHPAGTDPSTYKSKFARDDSATPSGSGRFQTLSSTDLGDDDEAEDDADPVTTSSISTVRRRGQHHPEGETNDNGQLFVRNKYTRAIGLKPKATVYLAVVSGRAEIRSNTINGADFFSYQTDCYNNFKISPKVLKAAGLAGNTRFIFKPGTDTRGSFVRVEPQ